MGKKQGRMMFKLNGKPMRPGDFEKALQKAAVASVAAQLRARIEAIRLPTTGEFPTVRLEGDTLGELTAHVEGSAELIALVKTRLSPEDKAMIGFASKAPPAKPQAFLSYGGEDRVLAELIARALMRSGVDTWWAEWEISAGDSLRQRIDQGLSSCTHFIVLMTPTSATKPWVNQEMDAGLVRRLQEQCAFIPLRHKLPVSNLPPLLSGMLSPEVDDGASNLEPLIHQILGVTRKPALGELPRIASLPITGYSAAATAIAEIFVREATHGLTGEIQFSTDELGARSGLSPEDTEDALHELNAFFIEASRTYLARASLYAEFDRHFLSFDTAEDAVKLAADFTNDPAFPKVPKTIAEKYDWAPRRLNSAITYLRDRDLIRGDEALATAPFVVFRIDRNDNTRRFVKSRS